MSIKTKLIIGAVFFIINLFIVESVFRAIYPPQPVMVRVLVQEEAGVISSDILSKLTFPNAFLNERIIKQVLLRQPAGPGKRDPEYDLDRRAKVVQEKDAHLIRIIVSGEDRSRAAAEANALAEEAVKYYQEKARENRNREIEVLRQEAENKRKNMMSLMGRIEGLKGVKQEEPQTVRLENEIQSREARIAVLLETYKPQHPEIVDLKNEIADLKKQKAIQPPMPVNPLPMLQANYESEKAAYQEIQSKLNQHLLEKEREIIPLKILAPAVAGTVPRLRTFPYALPLALFLILAAAVLGVYWSRPKDETSA